MKLIIMRGLPASGKTKKAIELLKHGNTVRLNKDSLRTMLHNDVFTGRNEGITRDAQKALANLYLNRGMNVIIDDTNLNPNTVQSWKDLAQVHQAKIEYMDMFDVSVEECISRDELRDKKVGKHVIQKMALQYLDYMKGESVIVCDIDGTICDTTHRQHYVSKTPKDWRGFFSEMYQDTLRVFVHKKIEEAFQETNAKYLVFVSARPEDYRTITENWLSVYYPDSYKMLIMRESNDKRPDTEVKAEIYDKYLKNLNIVKIFDDRPSVIRMWQEKGLPVEDVGNGIEF